MDGAKTQKAMGVVLGVSQPAVAKLVRHAEWPVKRKGPWSGDEVLAVLRWHEGLQENRAAPVTGDQSDLLFQLKVAKESETTKLKKEQRLTAELKRQILEQDRVTREMFEGALGGLAQMFIEMVEGWRLTIPSRFSGVDPEGLNLILDAGLKRLADKATVEAKSVEEVVQAAKAGRRGRPRSG